MNNYNRLLIQIKEDPNKKKGISDEQEDSIPQMDLFMGQIKIQTGILKKFIADSKSYKKISMLLKNRYGGFTLQVSIFSMEIL